MSTEPIHSGHFMTSNPHSDIGDEDEDVEVDVVDVDDSTSASAAEKPSTQFKDEKPITFYKFGPHKAQSIAIDVSLNKLNKCIKVAYMKMTTPKWKDFKGLKLQWKHRIRLNNVIWRAYYMEFRKPDKRKKTPYCYFAVPDDDMTHTKSECSVLEGMYWKRRREGVCAQYKRWRTYNRQLKRRPRGCCRKRENSCGCEPSLSIDRLMPPQSRTPQLLVSDDFYMDDDFDNVFTDRLFESLDGPFLFPNPKDSMQAGNADIMQPGLLSLQPSIEEIINIDYSLPDGANNDGLAFSDKVSREPGDNSSVGTQQQEASSQYTGSTATSTASHVDFLFQQQTQQQKYPLTLADTNNNSNGDRDGTFASYFNSKSLNIGDSSSYTAKEYDAANMLINYSNQKNFSHSQHRQQLRTHFNDSGDQLVVNGCSASSKLAFSPRYGPLKCESSSLGTGTYMSLVQAHTPQPLYSQAFYSINEGLPVCTGSGINQQRRFSSLDQIGISTAQQTVVPNTPVFQHLPQLQRQQLLSVSTEQQPQSRGQLQRNNTSATSSSSTPDASSSRLLPSSSSSAVLTLDQYMLAAAVAARSVSVAATSSTATLNSLGVVNSVAPSLFNARTTQQLLQQPQWWLQASTANSTTPFPPNTLTPSYEGQPTTLQFLRSAQILPENNHTIQQHQQERHIELYRQHPQQLFFSSNKSTSTTTAVLSFLQSAQQQNQLERATSTLPQLIQPAISQPHDLLLISQSQLLQQPSPTSSHVLSSIPAANATPITATSTGRCSTTNDLSRYLPTNIGISASSATVSTASVSLPEMFYGSPATNVSTPQHSMTGCGLMNQLNEQCSTSVRFDPLPAVQGVPYNDNNTVDIQLDGVANAAQSDDSTTILQFHQQCQQQQQHQSQVGYETSATSTASNKFESLQLPQPHLAGAFGQMQKNNKQSHHQQQVSQRQFSKPYPIKKFSQPIASINVGRPVLGVAPMTRPSSSDVYSMHEDSAPPNVKISRRSNLSESMSMDSILPGKLNGQTQKTSSSMHVGWMSDSGYSDATLSPSTPQPQQQHHQMLSPQAMVGGTSSAFSSPTTSGAGVSIPFTAPLAVSRQHQTSFSSVQISPTKTFLGIDSQDRSTSEMIGTLPTSLAMAPFSIEAQNGISNFQQISSNQMQYTEMKNVNGPRAGKRSSSFTNTTRKQTRTIPSSVTATTSDTERVFAASLSTLSVATAAVASTNTKLTESADSHGSLLTSQFAGTSVIDDGMLGMTTRVTDTDTLTPYEVIAIVKEEQEERSSSQMSLQESFRQKTSIASNRKQRGGGTTAGNNSSSSVPADSTLHPEERKRILHLHAEKNRRSALKEGFDALVDVIPFIEQAGVKSTNAVVLNRAAAYIRDLKTTSDERTEQVDALKQKIAQLNEKISLIQSNLPTTSRASSLALTTADGKSVPNMRSQIEQFFERYSKERSKRDYRFWLMSEIFAPVARSYAAKVHADASACDLVIESARQWLDREWNAATLRPLASETLVRVATVSGVFANDAPDALPKYILGEIAKLT